MTADHTDLTVTRLSTTAIKGLQMQHPDAIELTEHGAAGDRRFYLVDEAGGLASCTRTPELFGLVARWDAEARCLSVSRGDEMLVEGVIEPGSPAETDLYGLRTLGATAVADPRWDAFFSDLLGRRIRLLEAADSAYDVRPATLLGSASVAELARRSDLPAVDADRFRMLIEFSGGPPHVEDTWAGRLITIGDAALRAEGPVKRCAATTRNPADGAVDLQTLRLITGYRGRQESILGVGANFGIYAEVLDPGTVTVGDVLEVEPLP